jgi:hypothetical protein
MLNLFLSYVYMYISTIFFFFYFRFLLLVPLSLFIYYYLQILFTIFVDLRPINTCMYTLFVFCFFCDKDASLIFSSINSNIYPNLFVPYSQLCDLVLIVCE